MDEKIIKLDVKNQNLLNKCAQLYCEIWKEPPWNEAWKFKEVKNDIKNEMKRLNANGFLVITDSAEVVGFTWGYEVSKENLRKVSNINTLDFLFRDGKRVFYIDELGVDSFYRRKGIGEYLSRYLILTAQESGIRYFSLRTDTKAIAAKGLYSKLGFNDLHIKDAKHSQRTYWFLELL
jgi:ribosomal protein S18 acetylase RimI-like enzyme